MEGGGEPVGEEFGQATLRIEAVGQAVGPHQHLPAVDHLTIAAPKEMTCRRTQTVLHYLFSCACHALFLASLLLAHDCRNDIQADQGQG